MSKKLKRIIAIIALVFMGVFTVSLVCVLIDRTLLNGQIGFLALFSGAVGIGLFFVARFTKDAAEPDGADGETDSDDNAAASETEEDTAASDQTDSDDATALEGEQAEEHDSEIPAATDNTQKADTAKKVDGAKR